MADRYLYFILPGLIGALLLAGDEGRRRLSAHVPAALRGRPARALALAAAAAALIGFGARAHARARIWSSPVFVMADSAANYPEGVAGRLQAAKAAAQRGDLEEALRG